MTNEKTSAKVARIAGSILETLKHARGSDMIQYPDKRYEDQWSLCTVAELKALAASALTQTADKKLKIDGGRSNGLRRAGRGAKSGARRRQ